MMFLLINGTYAYGFYMGGWIIQEQIISGEQEYTGGVILACMFSVMFGAFYFGGIGPHIKAIAEAKVAGKLMFDVIDAVPTVVNDGQG
jgi:hypothetical protein